MNPAPVHPALAPRAQPASPTCRAARLAIELLPPYLVALVLLPVVISYGSFWPWGPSTIDLQVYVYAVRDLLAGRDIFATVTPFWNLSFIYPPVAAVLMVPLALGPYRMWQLLWTLGLVWAQQAVLRRSGLPRGWKLAVAGVAVVLAVEPIRTTLGYGQVNTFLMAFVILDLLPDPGLPRRYLPRGVLLGLATAIKLTPGLFVVFLLLLGRRRAAVTATVTFAVLTVAGAIVLPRQTWAFWTGLVGGDTRTAPPVYVGNQSLLGVADRLFGSGAASHGLGLAVGAVVALLAIVVAAWWWLRAERVFAVGLVGLATCLASPLSWTHHYVWVLPMAVALVQKPFDGLREHPFDRLRAPSYSRLPRWARGIAAVWVLWICACLPLGVLPYGGGLERSYSAFQELVANLGPLLGVLLIVGLAVQIVAVRRRVAGPARSARTGLPARAPYGALH